MLPDQNLDPPEDDADPPWPLDCCDDDRVLRQCRERQRPDVTLVCVDPACGAVHVQPRNADPVCMCCGGPLVDGEEKRTA